MSLTFGLNSAQLRRAFARLTEILRRRQAELAQQAGEVRPVIPDGLVQIEASA